MSRHWEHPHYQPKKQYRWANLKRGVIKLLLNLAILFGLVGLTGYGYLLFTHKVEFTPAIGSFLLLLGIATWVTLIIFLRRRYRRIKPSFKLTTFSVIAILLVFTFAGVQPMASYKDNLIESYKTVQTERAAEEALAIAQREAEMAAASVTQEYNFYKEYITLFNQFRQENGELPLMFDPELNELATRRAIEISQPGNFSHEGIKIYNFGENIAMLAYSSDSAESLIRLWASSPGHRWNMLSSQYHRTGFAKNNKFAVQIFD